MVFTKPKQVSRMDSSSDSMRCQKLVQNSTSLETQRRKKKKAHDGTEQKQKAVVLSNSESVSNIRPKSSDQHKIPQ